MHRAINLALMLATLAGAFALYAVKDGTRRLEARVQAQERALEKAENDVSVLAAERAHLARPERLEPLARKLGMTPMSAGQYLRVEAGPRVPSPSFVVPSPVVPKARTQDVGEGQGGGEPPTSAVGTPPARNPSPPGGGEPVAQGGGGAGLPSRRALPAPVAR
jgi:cell division protein FtsL